MRNPLAARRLSDRRLDGGGHAIWRRFFTLQNERRAGRENFSGPSVADLRQHHFSELRNVRSRQARRLERLEKTGSTHDGALRGVQFHWHRGESDEPARLDKTTFCRGGEKNHGGKSSRRRGRLEPSAVVLGP